MSVPLRRDSSLYILGPKVYTPTFFLNIYLISLDNCNKLALLWKNIKEDRQVTRPNTSSHEKLSFLFIYEESIKKLNTALF